MTRSPVYGSHRNELKAHTRLPTTTKHTSCFTATKTSSDDQMMILKCVPFSFTWRNNDFSLIFDTKTSTMLDMFPFKIPAATNLSKHPGLDWFQVGKVGVCQDAKKLGKFGEIQCFMWFHICYCKFTPIIWGRFAFGLLFFNGVVQPPTIVHHFSFISTIW